MTTTKRKSYVYEGTGSAVDDYLKPTATATPKTNTENWGLFDNNNQQHKTILSLLRQAQWTVPNGRWGEVADINRLSEFLKSDKSPVKKPLKKMESKEVSIIIVALEGIVKSKYK
jgi:hypothetical protein